MYTYCTTVAAAAFAEDKREPSGHSDGSVSLCVQIARGIIAVIAFAERIGAIRTPRLASIYLDQSTNYRHFQCDYGRPTERETSPGRTDIAVVPAQYYNNSIGCAATSPVRLCTQSAAQSRLLHQTVRTNYRSPDADRTNTGAPCLSRVRPNRRRVQKGLGRKGKPLPRRRNVHVIIDTVLRQTRATVG